METQVYRIDKLQLGNLQKRIMLRLFKIVGLSLIFIFAMQWQVYTSNFSIINILPVLFTTVFVAFIGWMSANKLKKSYASMEIVLSDSGVESKADSMPYKRIAWTSLVVQEKKNGSILLYDSSVSGFMRKMYGNGAILVQPEVYNKELLLAELLKLKDR